MRTTLQLDDDVLQAARYLAETERKTIGQVISELVRRALAPRPLAETGNDFPCFSVSPDASPITPEMVHRAAEDP